MSNLNSSLSQKYTLSLFTLSILTSISLFNVTCLVMLHMFGFKHASYLLPLALIVLIWTLIILINNPLYEGNYESSFYMSRISMAYDYFKFKLKTSVIGFLVIIPLSSITNIMEYSWFYFIIVFISCVFNIFLISLFKNTPLPYFFEIVYSILFSLFIVFFISPFIFPMLVFIFDVEYFLVLLRSIVNQVVSIKIRTTPDGLVYLSSGNNGSKDNSIDPLSTNVASYSTFLPDDLSSANIYALKSMRASIYSRCDWLMNQFEPYIGLPAINTDFYRQRVEEFVALQGKSTRIIAELQKRQPSTVFPTNGRVNRVTQQLLNSDSDS